jgi:hypothetical protein
VPSPLKKDDRHYTFRVNEGDKNEFAEGIKLAGILLSTHLK